MDDTARGVPGGGSVNRDTLRPHGLAARSSIADHRARRGARRHRPVVVVAAGRAEVGGRRPRETRERPVEAASSTPAAGEPQVVKVEEHADLIGAPPLCKTIVEWHRRNVPAWVIEDNMDAQAMKFDAEEMKCLAEKGVPDQVLDRAEYNQRVPQPARKP